MGPLFLPPVRRPRASGCAPWALYREGSLPGLPKENSPLRGTRCSSKDIVQGPWTLSLLEHSPPWGDSLLETRPLWRENTGPGRLTGEGKTGPRRLQPTGSDVASKPRPSQPPPQPGSLVSLVLQYSPRKFGTPLFRILSCTLSILSCTSRIFRRILSCILAIFSSILRILSCILRILSYVLRILGCILRIVSSILRVLCSIFTHLQPQSWNLGVGLRSHSMT